MTEKLSEPRRVAASTTGMVATAHEEATGAGVEILAEGGNAVDAAVAAAFALGACEPQASGLGGQTMILMYHTASRKTVALDGSSRAPNRATVEVYADKALRRIGYTAATVPSTPAVLAYAADRYGKLPLSRLLEPAIRIAREGYAITALQAHLQNREKGNWSRGNAGPLFLRNGTQPYAPGDTFRQPVLADTLGRLAEKGIEEFYLGDIGARIEEDMIQSGGLIRRDDLARIPWPIERRPVSCRFEGYRLHTFPPPGAGRTLAEMLNILALFPEKLRNPDTIRGSVLLVEVIRRAQLDRRDRPFDPNLYPQVEERHMTNTDYAKTVARQIRSRLRSWKKKISSRPSEPAPEPLDESRGDTTHISVMDGEGNAVGLTQSIERAYASFCATPDLGFLYNNYMQEFEFEDYTHPYYLHPNGVPWASVAPTIVFKGRKPWMVLGSPGSDRIVSALLQVFLHAQTVSPLMAVTAPRLHCSAAGKVFLESLWMRNDIGTALRKRGFLVEELESFAFYMGSVQLVKRTKDTLIGVADPRRDGSAGGPP
jgi:gamma-glutamyltranspeptidase/glutathione hydrolase